MYAQSRYFKTGSAPRYRERLDYNPPPAGSYLSYITGILEAYNNQWEVVPCYPEDLGPVLVSPPFISNVKRDKAVVGSSDDVTVTCKVEGRLGALVDTVFLYTRSNFGVIDSIGMMKGTESIH